MLRILKPTLFLLACAMSLSFAQSPEAEFVSLSGRFGIQLPPNYADYKTSIQYDVNGRVFSGSSYLWPLGEQRATVTYANGEVNLENAPEIETNLKLVREEMLRRHHPGSLIGEKRTSLSGHPGLISVVEGQGARTMLWVYLFRSRFYALSLSIGDPARLESDVKTMSTFRFVPLSELEPRFAKLAKDIEPPSVGQESGPNWKSSDLVDLRLKGKVKQITTDTERFLGSELDGVRARRLVEEFNEQGNLIRAIEFDGLIPQAVRLYGFVNGERAYRERRKERNVVLQGSREAVNAPAYTSKLSTATFMLKYKYDKSGKITEVRVESTDGVERERWLYSPGRIEHLYNPMADVPYLEKLGAINKTREVHTLDTDGNVAETARTIRDAPEGRAETFAGKTEMVYRDQYKTETFVYRYEFDEQGNWVRQTKLAAGKKKGDAEVPLHVTYRTIVYF